MTVKSNYVGKVYIVYAITLADLVLNGIVDHSASGGASFMALVWIGVQLFIQLLNLTIFAMMLFDTYLFQVGLVGVLVREFRGLLGGLGLYALLYGAYAAVKASQALGSGMSEDAMWSDGLFTAFSILQKIGALCYYVLILFYTAKLGQPQWYQKHHWVQKYSALARGAFNEGMAQGAGR